MPEGHTVHRLAKVFQSSFAGRTIFSSSPQGRFSSGAALISGKKLSFVQAIGKQLVLGFGEAVGETPENLLLLRVHLGIYGSWRFDSDGSVQLSHAIGAPRAKLGEKEVFSPSDSTNSENNWSPEAPRGQVRLRLETSATVADLTGPTVCELMEYSDYLALLARLGPDPLDPFADASRFYNKVARSKTEIALLLMDQSVLAGIGNIYRAEVLFRCRVDPFLAGNSIPGTRVEQLWEDIVPLMADGARTGRIVTTEVADRADSPPVGYRSTHQNTDADPSVVPDWNAFYVYQRTGLPCRVCGTEISLKLLAARKLYWCSNCQY